MLKLLDVASPFVQVAFYAVPIIVIVILVALAVWGALALIKNQKKKKALEDYFSSKEENKD